MPTFPSPTIIPSQATPILETPPTATPSAIPLPTATQQPTPLPLDLSIDVNDVYLYPTAAIYAGDKVTFQILPHVPENVDSQNVTVEILIDGTILAQDTLGGRNHLSGEVVGLFEWAWDRITSYNVCYTKLLRGKKDHRKTILDGNKKLIDEITLT